MDSYDGRAVTRRTLALAIARLLARLGVVWMGLPGGSPAWAQELVNWESAHVHPLAMTPDGASLLAVNTADHRLEVFSLSERGVERAFNVPVGLDPVSVRARSSIEAWVVNRISDSVSVVDLRTRQVVATLATEDEPADVVFAGQPQRAYVTCSQTNALLVFDPARLAERPVRIEIEGEEPRALAVSSDGKRVYAAIFASGNRSTILAGGARFNIDFPPNIVGRAFGPYGGKNPPPNAPDEGGFQPPQRPENPKPPAVGLIVKRGADGAWRDDLAGDWTHLVSGANAAQSGRPEGWDLIDHDLAIVDTATQAVSYARHMMNACMALAVHPTTAAVHVVGTDATNERRFEPVLRGRFLRVVSARASAAGAALEIRDLNPHLDYASGSVEPALRKRSLGDPRAIAWSPGGERGYVAGMGSNNLVAIDAQGARMADVAPIEVAEGPTGLAWDSARGRLYVMAKFAAAISVVDLAAGREVARVTFFDPTPQAIRRGRKHLYDTHATSGLGQASCASCHIDARMDHLAWDLGDPAGSMADFAGNNLAANLPQLTASEIPGRGPFQAFHPMKGPMTTQTLVDIVGKEPLHWRGDRRGIEAFSAAFQTLLGGDAGLPPAAMQELEDFLASLTFPPNPFRNLDNSLPEDLSLAGHFTTGRFGDAGKPLPNGNAQRGLERFRTGKLDNLAVDCVTCHTLPTGMGTDHALVGKRYEPIAPGPLGERHLMLVSQDGSTNVTMKVPQLRNLYEKVGFDLTRQRSRLGFGFLHDGSVDSLARFLNEPAFSLKSDQDTADLIAFLLAFSGSDLPRAGHESPLQPPGPTSRDTHAAVGRQVTLHRESAAVQRASLESLVRLARAGRIGLIAKGRLDGVQRGWCWVEGDRLQSDRAGESVPLEGCLGAAVPECPLTFTAVPREAARRMGIDRDADGSFDRDEIDAQGDPADPTMRPRAGR